MLNDTIHWLKQKDGEQGSQEVANMQEQRQSGTFRFSDPILDQGERG